MNYNPNEVFIKIKKLEFKYLAIPFILIILNFLLVYLYNIQDFKYLSLLFLFVYFFIKFIFRINKIDIIQNSNAIKSPITGNVIKIENNKITIRKNFFDKADFRYSLAKYRLIKGKLHIFSDISDQSVLIGIVPGNAVIEIELPDNYIATIKKGEKVISGVTDIGKLYEQN